MLGILSLVADYYQRQQQHSEFGCRSTWHRSWLRYCASSRKAAGSIPDGIIVIFHWRNHFGCTMALASTQALKCMCDQGSKSGRFLGLTKLPPLMCCLGILGASTSWSPNGLPRTVWGYLYLDNGLRIVQTHTLCIFSNFKRIAAILPPLQLRTVYSTLGIFVFDLQ